MSFLLLFCETLRSWYFVYLLSSEMYPLKFSWCNCHTFYRKSLIINSSFFCYCLWFVSPTAASTLSSLSLMNSSGVNRENESSSGSNHDLTRNSPFYSCVSSSAGIPSSSSSSNATSTSGYFPPILSSSSFQSGPMTTLPTMASFYSRDASPFLSSLSGIAHHLFFLIS